MTKFQIAREIQKINPHSCMEIMYDSFTKKELIELLESLKKRQNDK